MKQAQYEARAEATGLRDRVLRYLRIMSKFNRWIAPYEICDVLAMVQIFVSESSVSARIRDLRKPRYGSHVIVKRKRENSRAYEYMLMDGKEKASAATKET